MLSLIGLLAGLALLIYFAVCGMHLLVAAPLAAFVIAITGGIPLLPQTAAEWQASYMGIFMDGFTGFFKDWFFMFLLGAIFGKAMEKSYAAESIAHWVIGHIGIRHAALALVAACAILTYGGVSVFIVAFCVYSMALGLFRQANLPRRFIPAAIAFGSITFTMTSAGSPEIQNWIPIRYLNTSPYAGWEVSIIVAVFMAVIGYLWLRKMLRTAVANGEQFEGRSEDVSDNIDYGSMPNPLLCTLPLIAVLGVSFFCHQQFGTAALILALFSGLALTYLFNFKYFANPGQPFSEGATGALVAIANTCAVVGFGTVAKVTPAFTSIVQVLTDIPGGGLIGAAIAVTVICGLTGSASGGQSIALPLLAPIYTGLDVAPEHRVDPDALHRVVSIASGGLDSLPHNGYVVTLIRAICGETHRDAYLPVANLTVIVPFLGLALALVGFILF